ncbi:hypothetical protein P171DRAFT_437195 [Karstenula rhodostoma CBS 690.94]|uniref:DUF7730 domain-containing protein n=1 Tax=Karstenula rhodostoma CBS 690.94 TaxID=1392251 RepID=A0A9P4U6G7_9PLEO|nr:hypothetical protein P171DRAFT_437195 [Karstenula rhodostoma CBS 690.94]
MACTMGYEIGQYMGKVAEVAAKEQPRQAANCPHRHRLPHADARPQIQSLLLKKLNLDCRLIIWRHVFHVPHTRLERWRPLGIWSLKDASRLDADCFPYRISTPGRFEQPSCSNLPPGNTLALLLCCRQLYSEGLKLLYSSTSFVFSRPLDLHCFQLVVSPEGFGHVKSLIIAHGRVDSDEPLFTEHIEYGQERFQKWEKAVHSLHEIRHLQELQVLLSHRVSGEIHPTQRPWRDGAGRTSIERRHQQLFELFETVNATDLTIMLSWNPTDVLSQRNWRFRLMLQTADEINEAGEALMGPEFLDDQDLYE